MCGWRHMHGWTIAAQQPAPAIVVLQPDRVFDGESMRAGWIVVVRGERIDAAKATWQAQGFGHVSGDNEFIPLPDR